MALAALTALALVGLIAAWRVWPKDDAAVLPHDHLDLPQDHPHWKQHPGDSASTHAHAYVIDDVHRRWPA